MKTQQSTRPAPSPPGDLIAICDPDPTPIWRDYEGQPLKAIAAK